MLSHYAVASREREQLSLAEFAYQLLQTEDWLVLRRRRDCRLQLGGVDQLGNLVSGIVAADKEDSTSSAFGLLVPILADDRGNKLGKSTGAQVSPVG